MTDPQFFQTAGPFSLGKVLAHLGLDLDASATLPDPNLLLSDVAPLSEAAPLHLSFYHNPAYASALKTTKAGAVLVPAEALPLVPAGTAAIAVADPYRSYGQIAALFHPTQVAVQTVIDPSARVAEDAQLGEGVVIGAFTSIGEGAKIGAGTVIEAQVSVGPGVVLGRACHVGAGVSLSHAVIGDRVHFKPGARIGQSGFGWALNHSGADDGLHQRIPQLGRVMIGDDVEIGANATVDRGSGPDTTIGAGTVLDNHCLIAHNVHIGRRCVMAGFSGVAGSGILEDDVIVGARVSILGHLRVGAKTIVMAGSQVTKSFPAGLRLSGVPAQEHRQYLREQATLRRLTQQQDFDAAPVTPGENTTAAPAPDKGDTKDG